MAPLDRLQNLRIRDRKMVLGFGELKPVFTLPGNFVLRMGSSIFDSFYTGTYQAQALTIGWVIVFFFASAAASSAYLTVSETFPLEIRALAIAFFYAVGTGVGGVVGPWLFGALIDTGSRMSLFGGYLLGAVLMILAAAVMWRWGIAAERKPLEQVARPLAFMD